MAASTALTTPEAYLAELERLIEAHQLDVAVQLAQREFPRLRPRFMVEQYKLHAGIMEMVAMMRNLERMPRV